jgi:hypothetical protein
MRTLTILSVMIGMHPVVAVNVQVAVLQNDYCGQSVGIMQATASDGAEPYRYDWFSDDGSGFVPLCTDCGPEITDLPGNTNYKVLVTDDLGAMAEANDYLWPADLSILDEDIVIFPHVATEQPYMKLYVGTSMTPGASAIVEVIGAELVYQPDFPGDGIGIWWFRLLQSTGSIGIQYTFLGGECSVQRDFTRPPPTVLPTMGVVDGQGSCSNAPTGSVTFALTNGSLPQPLAVILNGNTSYTPGIWTGQQVVGATTLVTVNNLGAGSYTFHLSGNNTTASTPTDMGFPYQCFASVPFVVANEGATCGRAQGRVFVDNNLNCGWQGSEPGVMNSVLEVLPGPTYVTTIAGGQYDLTLAPGAYTMELQSDVIEEHCVETPIPFTITGATTPVTVNHASVSLVPLDVAAVLGSGAARPGFEYVVGLSLRNHTPAPSGALTVSLSYDPVLGFISAGSTPPSTATSGTLTWNLPQFSAFQQRQIVLRFQIPPDVGLLGSELLTSVVVSTGVPDAVPTNNTTSLSRTVTGSYDPNDKLVSTSLGSGSQWLLDEDEWIDYTIRFQNTGTDTAFHVLITDTLPSNLDPLSLQMGAGSHPFNWELRDAGTLKFRFFNILLPDSNINEPRSHGFVSFRIRPRLPLLPGDHITNIANIHFDFNPPVITDPSVLTVVSPIRLDARVWLGGAYDALATLMRDDLRTQSLIPLTEPYTALGYTHSGDGGGETIAPALLNITGPTAIVDWVLLELRSTAQPSTVLHSRAALLRRDGRITDKDGTSPVAFAAPAGTYRLALLHRNHLGVISAAPIALSSTATTWDTRTTATALFGTAPTSVAGSTRLLWPGDGSGDGTVKYSGVNNDRDPVLVAIGGTVPTNVVSGVYSPLDINLDGQLRYAGANNDRDIILQTIGGTVPTAVKVQQLP